MSGLNRAAAGTSINREWPAHDDKVQAAARLGPLQGRSFLEEECRNGGGGHVAVGAECMSDSVRSGTSSLTGRRLLIIEEALRTTAGHFFEYDRAVKESSQKRGAVAIVAGHANMDTAVKASLDGIPAFPRTCWEIGFDKMGTVRRQWEILRHNLMFYRTVRRLLREHGPFDVIFAPTVTIYHAIALAVLARTVPKSQGGRFISFFRNSISIKEEKGEYKIDTLKRFIWKQVFRSLASSSAKGRAAMVTDSRRLAEEYMSVAGGSLTVMPHPAMTVRSLIPVREFASVPFTFGHLGPPRLEKGTDILLDAIEAFLKARPSANVRFLLQWNQPMALPDGRQLDPAAQFAQEPRVQLIRETLSSEQYMSHLESVDCMALPYRRSAYSGRISGVAVEAATSGQCLIVPEDTWLSDLLEDHGHGMTVPDGNSQALADAMIQTFDNRQAMAARARERAPLASAFHSNDHFIERLWGADGTLTRTIAR